MPIKGLFSHCCLPHMLFLTKMYYLTSTKLRYYIWCGMWSKSLSLGIVELNTSQLMRSTPISQSESSSAVGGDFKGNQKGKPKFPLYCLVGGVGGDGGGGGLISISLKLSVARTRILDTERWQHQLTNCCPADLSPYWVLLRNALNWISASFVLFGFFYDVILLLTNECCI